MTKTWCIDGKHYSESINQNIYEKLNLKIKKKLLKFSMVNVLFAIVKSQFLTK